MPRMQSEPWTKTNLISSERDFAEIIFTSKIFQFKYHFVQWLCVNMWYPPNSDSGRTKDRLYKNVLENFNNIAEKHFLLHHLQSILALIAVFQLLVRILCKWMGYLKLRAQDVRIHNLIEDDKA